MSQNVGKATLSEGASGKGWKSGLRQHRFTLKIFYNISTKHRKIFSVTNKNNCKYKIFFSMENSSVSIIAHIPHFLDYCEVEKGLRKNTQENYKNYLEKFLHGWISKNNSILPHQLTSEHIWAYRLFFSRTPSPATGKLLSKGTQNYYLIALRALLGYFVAKDIQSLPPDKIALAKADRGLKSIKFLL